MQQCLANHADWLTAVSPPPLDAEGPVMRHRALLLTGARRGARGDSWLARRVLDRLLLPAAQVEGVDLHLGDPWLFERAAGATSFALLLPPIGNLSNPFYTVHPRRNDRFLVPRDPLRALYPEVDFAPFAFTGHALGTLAAICPVRFAELRRVLSRCWEGRMRDLLNRLPRDGTLITLPQPGFLVQPMIHRRGLRVIDVDPDDRTLAAQAFAVALFGAGC